MKSRLAATGVLLLLVCPQLGRTATEPFTVDHLGGGVYAFQANFFSNIFIVTSEGVVATDPISPDVARLYRQAIQRVTRLPVRYVIYSHDHSDHISGGRVFRDTARFIAHANAEERIRVRRNPEIVPPDITFEHEYTVTLGGTAIRLLYLGPNHSTSNIAILVPSAKVLMFVDIVYPGSVPFRDLPGTDLREFLATLPRVRSLEFQTLVYGHGPAGGKEWVDRYIAYFDDLTLAVERAKTGASFAIATGRGMDARKTLDAEVNLIAARAVEALRSKYGAWGGFEEWAPMNAKAVYFFLMMDA